jgi:hypothetical protein
MTTSAGIPRRGAGFQATLIPSGPRRAAGYHVRVTPGPPARCGSTSLGIFDKNAPGSHRRAAPNPGAGTPSPHKPLLRGVGPTGAARQFSRNQSPMGENPVLVVRGVMSKPRLDNRLEAGRPRSPQGGLCPGRLGSACDSGHQTDSDDRSRTRPAGPGLPARLATTSTRP